MCQTQRTKKAILITCCKIYVYGCDLNQVHLRFEAYKNLKLMQFVLEHHH